MKHNDWKDRLGMVYSTNPDFRFEKDETNQVQTPLPHQQKLRVFMERAGRGGKTVTLVKGFQGKEEDLSELGKFLKSKCGVGGSIKDGEIIIQGDHRARVLELLLEKGYTNSK